MSGIKKNTYMQNEELILKNHKHNIMPGQELNLEQRVGGEAFSPTVFESPVLNLFSLFLILFISQT